MKGTLLFWCTGGPLFTELDIEKEERTLCATNNVRNFKLWKAKYFLVKAVYAGLIALRYVNSNTAAMCKTY